MADHKGIMIQGTMSGVGKSALVAGLCRIFRQEGLSPAPFKSQNMALNSYITKDGLEMGRAQVMQAYASGLEPSCSMNPILLKPTGDRTSQVIVMGRAERTMSATDYFAYKKELIPVIKKAYHDLASLHSPMVVEGAGSPAEINLKENDIVNMGLAEMLDLPVLLTGDIDRGGVFAQLVGTMELLTPAEKARVKGFIINKFRGDPSLLTPGIKELEDRTGVPVLGVIPYVQNLMLEDEDSLSEKLERGIHRRTATGIAESAVTAACASASAPAGAATGAAGLPGIITIAVIRLPRISNFTDFDPFLQNPAVSLIYTTDPGELEKADLVIIPGTKNTIADMRFLKESGLAAKIVSLAGRTPLFGVCGGYQMLGERIDDPDGAEEGGSIEGLGLLPVSTTLLPEKTQTLTEGTVSGRVAGIFENLAGLHYSGYEIHAGRTVDITQVGSAASSAAADADPQGRIAPDSSAASGSTVESGGSDTSDNLVDITRLIPSTTYMPTVFSSAGDIYGTYIHGFFDEPEITNAILSALAAKKGLSIDLSHQISEHALREIQYDRLADAIRTHADMDRILELIS